MGTLMLLSMRKCVDDSTTVHQNIACTAVSWTSAAALPETLPFTTACDLVLAVVQRIVETSIGSLLSQGLLAFGHSFVSDLLDTGLFADISYNKERFWSMVCPS